MKSKLFLFLIICVVLGAYGIEARARQAKELNQDTAANAITTVSVMQPKSNEGTDDIILPGQVEAWHSAPIYARTNGYIAKWHTDIGAHVKQGEVLAEIDTPEIDAQYAQAEADLATATANNALAQITVERWKKLVKTDSVTKQETDEKIGDADAKAAALSSAKANRDRLKDLEDFKKIIAPFNGVISARNIDVGSLVNAGAGAQELFHIVEKDKLRVYVEVPQMYTQRLMKGMTMELHFAEFPGKDFPAVLSTDADALDPVTRTLRVELMVDNKDESLLPGGYTEVHIKVPAAEDGMRLPVNTLLYRATGVFVATVDPQNQVRLKQVTLGRDFGTEVEVTAGLTDKEQVILNPADSIAEGQQVRIAQVPAAVAAVDKKAP